MPLSEAAIYKQKHKIFKMPPTLILMFYVVSFICTNLKPLPHLAQLYTYSAYY